MATTKPAAAAAEKTNAPPATKSKKMLIIVSVIAVVALLGGGAAGYFLMKPAHPPAKEAAATEETHPEAPPKYVALGTFTANLIHEEGDRYLQVAISIKISNPELEEKIKASNPEILHHVNMLLQSKRPSELSTLEGKDNLSYDIKSQVEQVLGLSKAEPDNHSPQSESSPARRTNTGIEEVLFTSFIIQ